MSMSQYQPQAAFGNLYACIKKVSCSGSIYGINHRNHVEKMVFEVGSRLRGNKDIFYF